MRHETNSAGWHPASHPVSQARIADVARRAGDIDDKIVKPFTPPSYFPARRTTWLPARNGLAMAIVAQCPDGRVEHYGSVSEAAEAMNGFSSSILHVIDGMNTRGTHTFRDRRWFRAGTYQKNKTVDAMASA